MARNEKTNPKITNQKDIDNYIDRMIMTAEKEIEILFTN
ncbi:phage head morphogenesis protein, partial [Streptococcus equi]|nr:phage head morphogenesis protein [Streptococcus equi]